MEVIGVVADTAPSSVKGVRYGAFGGGGVTAIVAEVLLGIGGFDVDRGAEMTMFNADIDVVTEKSQLDQIIGERYNSKLYCRLMLSESNCYSFTFCV